MFDGINDPYLLDSLYKELHIYLFSKVLEKLKKVTLPLKNALDRKSFSLMDFVDGYYISYYYLFKYGLK